MDRIPAYVDDMGETVFVDDLRAGLLFIKMRCRQGVQSHNSENRAKNRRALRVDKGAVKVAESHTGIHRRAARALARHLDHRDKITKRIGKATPVAPRRARREQARRLAKASVTLEAGHIDISEPTTCTIPRTTRWE